MPDPFDLPGDDPAAPEARDEVEADSQIGPFPWDTEPPEGAEAADPLRQRHDGFTEARKSEFLKALVKTGSITDACRRTGVSRRTVYRHQHDSPSFFEHCRLALGMSGTPIELTAWQRAVEGVEEEVVVGGRVQVRRRYSEGLLRMLLRGSNPTKYGPRPGFKRKRLLKHERKAIEREVRAEIAAERREPTIAEVKEHILERIEAIERHGEPKKLAAGWTRSPDGHWVPPGYAPVPGWEGAAGAVRAEADEGGTPRDSM